MIPIKAQTTTNEAQVIPTVVMLLGSFSDLLQFVPLFEGCVVVEADVVQSVAVVLVSPTCE